ncbi:MAG: 3-oxoacyl-[acyl-carrier-protein] reductase FabG [Saprospiraceae bacterium]|jgi:3-oxoacyl-[acyl-carrier protein] reductase|nr:3-oxoacyl-[acyl-carrier-protein] reductase FabG [Saprospiraceae bacterium]
MISIDLSGYNALVCGASRGIGRACASVLARAGASVVALARDGAELERLIGQLHGTPGQKHQYLVADMGNPLDLDKKLTPLVLEHPLHILVNNTGGPPGGAILQARGDAFESAFRQHLMSSQVLVQKCVPSMVAAHYGRIINILSTSVKQPIENLGVSNTIRAAVANWAKTLAGELAGQGITVNNVLPGATLTDRLVNLSTTEAEKRGISVESIRDEMLHAIPSRRFATPEEIAHAVAFLSSPLAAYITGINLPVDGGRTRCL